MESGAPPDTALRNYELGYGYLGSGDGRVPGDSSPVSVHRGSAAAPGAFDFFDGDCEHHGNCRRGINDDARRLHPANRQSTTVGTPADFYSGRDDRRFRSLTLRHGPALAGAGRLRRTIRLLDHQFPCSTQS